MDPEDAQVAAQAAIGNLIQQIDPNAMVTKFVALVEIVDTEGERAVWSLASPDQKTWDSLGLIEYARALEYASERDD